MARSGRLHESVQTRVPHSVKLGTDQLALETLPTSSGPGLTHGRSGSLQGKKGEEGQSGVSRRGVLLRGGRQGGGGVCCLGLARLTWAAVAGCGSAVALNAHRLQEGRTGTSGLRQWKRCGTSQPGHLFMMQAREAARGKHGASGSL